MTEPDWAELVEKYIVLGETPNLQNPWDVEEPETFLRRPYYASGKPAGLRNELIRILDRALENDQVTVLNRGLRLTKLIPHQDFAHVLQNVFFTAHGRSRKGPTGSKYREIALLAIKAMYSIQAAMSSVADAHLPFWKGMWISLLNDRDFGIPAYNGLRRLDIQLALKQLPLMLRRTDLSRDDLGVILRGTRRDIEKGVRLESNLDSESELKEAIQKDMQDALLKTVAQLTEYELCDYQSFFREAFGEKTIDAVIRRAENEGEEDLKRNTSLLTPQMERPLSSLRKLIFPGLVEWLTKKLPVNGVSIWLVDQEKSSAHFMWQVGIHDFAAEPPGIIKFGEYVTGTVAQKREHLLRDFESSEGPPVLKLDGLRAEGFGGVFSVFAEGAGSQDRGNREPSLDLVVNFFDKSLEKLSQLQAPCIRLAGVTARTAQDALVKYTDSWVAHVTTRLTKEPVLYGAVETFDEAICKALPYEETLPFEEERVALYLYAQDSRSYFLYAYYDSRNKKLFPTPDAQWGDFFLDVDFVDSFNKESAIRIFDLGADKLPKGFIFHRQRLNLDKLEDDQTVSYIGVPLREPALPGQVGRMVGLIEKYRIIKKGSGRVFTPVGQHVLVEMVKPAAQPFIKALDQELRLSGPVPSSVVVNPQIMKPSQKATFGDVDRVFQEAEDEFQQDAQDLLGSWYVTDDATQTFIAFRTLYDKCKAYWVRRVRSFDSAEKDARRAFQHAILTKESLVKTIEPCELVTPELLKKFGIADKEQVEIISSLRIVLIPLLNGGRPNGLIGLEFNSDETAIRVVRDIKRQQDRATHFVRMRTMDTWLDHRQHLVSLFAMFLERFSTKAAEEKWVQTAKHFFNFVARGQADLPPNEKSFVEFTTRWLNRPPSDAQCVFTEECRNWEKIAEGRLHLKPEVYETQSFLAMPSAVRMVLATSSAPMLWGETANVSIEQNEPRAEWSRLTIEVPSNGNGHGDIRKQALALAKWISEYRGWSCDKKGSPNGIVIMLPHTNNKRAIPN